MAYPRCYKDQDQILIFSGIKPLELIVLCEYGAVRLAAVGVVALLGVDAVKLGGLVAAADEGSEVKIGGAVFRQGGDADLAEEVDAVGRRSDADRLEIVGAEASEVMIGEVFLLSNQLCSCFVTL